MTKPNANEESASFARNKLVGKFSLPEVFTDLKKRVGQRGTIALPRGHHSQGDSKLIILFDAVLRITEIFVFANSYLGFFFFFVQTFCLLALDFLLHY